MRLIDADAFKTQVAAVTALKGLNVEKAALLLRLIDQQLTIDAVPVVRCKDCRKRGTNKCPMYEDSEEIQMDWTGDDWFCSLGERMDADAPERAGRERE